MTFKKHVLRRFFVIYFTFLFCLLLLMIPGYRLSLKEVEARTLDTMNAVLGAGLEQFDSALWSASVAASTIYSNENIYSLFTIDSGDAPRYAIRIRNGINDYKGATDLLPMVSDTGLLMRNGSLLASGRYFFQAEDAWGSFISAQGSQGFADWSRSLLSGGGSYALMPARVTTSHISRDALVLAMTLPVNATSRSTMFYAIYDLNQIVDVLMLPQYASACSLTLTDDGGNPLINWSPSQLKSTVSIGQTSARYGLNVTMQIDTALFARDMRGYRQAILLALLFMLFGGVLLTVAYTWHSAKPMLSVLNDVQATGQGLGMAVQPNAQDRRGGFYRYICAFISRMGEEVTVSRREQQEQFVLLRDNVFDRLLRDGSANDRLIDRARNCFPDFPACCRMVVVKTLHIHSIDTASFTAMQAHIVDCLQGVLPPESIIHAMADATLHLTVALWPCRMEDGDELFVEPMAELAAGVRRRRDLETQLIISAPFSGMDRLPAVFGYLTSRLRLTGSMGERLVFAGDIPSSTKPVSASHLPQFHSHLTHGRCAEAIAMLESDMANLTAGGAVKDVDVQQLYFVYRHAIAQAGHDMLGDEAGDIPLPGYRASDTIDELFDQLKACCAGICQRFDAQRQRSEADFEQRIVQFIQCELTNPALCVRYVTDQFGISETTLRRVMQNAAGMGFLEYVEGGRMAMARQLITASDTPIGKIPEMCGYASANSFYKAFRRRYGLSPSAMRDGVATQAL